MKKTIFYFLSILISLCLFSCASVPSFSKDRVLTLSGVPVLETDYGGVERWYAVDKYNYDSLVDEVRFQVGYFIDDNSFGFILYGKGTTGEEAYFSRDGLNLRWDWGHDGIKGYMYSFIIEPNGTGLYYDFSTSKDGIAKPRGIYKTKKF